MAVQTIPIHRINNLCSGMISQIITPMNLGSVSESQGMRDSGAFSYLQLGRNKLSNFLPGSRSKLLRNLKSLIPLPPSSPSLQITEACFMGGTYPAFTPQPGYVPLLVGMVLAEQLVLLGVLLLVDSGSCMAAEWLKGRLRARLAIW